MELSRIIHIVNAMWVLSSPDTHPRGHVHFASAAAPQDPKPGYDGFLTAVLAPGLPGDCWIRQQPCDESELGDWVQCQASNVAALVSALKQSLDTGLSAATSGIPHGLKVHLRHRFFLTAARFRALCGSRLSSPTMPAPYDYVVLLDVRFFSRRNQLRCHTSTSIWSAPPRYSEHCPPPFQNDGDTALAGTVEAYHSLFRCLSQAIEEELNRLFSWDGFDMFGRRFGLPTFWIAVPNPPHLPPDPLEYVHNTRSAAGLPTQFLGRDARDRTVAHGVVNGDLLVLRRLVRTDEHAGRPSSVITRESPTYLIMPATARTADIRERSQVEVATADIITNLTDLEAHAQHQLYDVQADLEIWRNHLTIYNAVVERGAFLWDALSSHLPIRRGLGLAKTHRAVALVHQVLLQAVADLAHIATLVRSCSAQVADACEELRDSYDQTISEFRGADEPELRSALIQVGLVEHVSQLAFETNSNADRVKTAYEDQLAAIAHAFDERRARELDSLQKGTFALSAAAAVFGISTIADTTVQLKNETEPGATAFGVFEIAKPVTVGTLLASAILLLTAGITLYRQRRTSFLGSRQFRALYNRGKHALDARHRRQRDVWAFLADTSSDSLHHAAYHDPEFATNAQRWHDHDLSLTTWLSEIWDSGSALANDRGSYGRRDLRSLTGHLERWAIHSLILTERARRIHVYPLPNLTCIYRCCTRVRNSFVQHLRTPEVNAVADVDFERSMARLGFTAEQSNEIDHWLISETYDSAAHAAERISRLGLSVVDMTDDDRARTLRTVRTPP